MSENSGDLCAPGTKYPAPAQADRDRAIAYARAALRDNIVVAASQPDELKNLARQFLRALGLSA